MALTPRMPTPLLRAIVRAELSGMKRNDIAKKLGITPQCISYWRGSEIYKKMTEELQSKTDEKAVEVVAEKFVKDPVQELLRETALLAAQVNKDLLDDENPRVRQASSWDILDRAGYPKAQKVEVARDVTAGSFITPEALKALASAILESHQEPVQRVAVAEPA